MAAKKSLQCLGIAAGQSLALFGLLGYGAVLLMAVVPLVLQRPEGQLGQEELVGLFLLSTGMAIFSGVLLGVMAFGIRDCCPFCILSVV